MFCTQCGSSLIESARFCTKCGAPVKIIPKTQSTTTPVVEESQSPAQSQTVEQQVQTEVQSQTVEQEPQIEVQPQPEVQTQEVVEQPQVAVQQQLDVQAQEDIKNNQAQPVVQQETKTNLSEKSSSQEEVFKFNAAKEIGETALGTLKQNAKATAIEMIPGPGKVLSTGFKQFFKSIGAFFKNPLALIFSILVVLIYPAIWTILNVIQAAGVNPWPLKIVSFLLCANGGMSGGFFGGFGGIIGKGVFVGGIVTLISIIFRKKGTRRRSFGEVMKGSFGVSLDTLGVIFTGIGWAHIFYLFLTGGATRISCLVGISAMIIAARSAANNGFLARFLTSLTAKAKFSSRQAGAGLMRGFAYGYGLSAILGLITGTRIIPIILAVLYMLLGGIFIILQLVGVIKPRKG